MSKILVDEYALYQILKALNANSVEIHEWMVTRNLTGEISKSNPINILTREFNEHVAKKKAEEDNG